MFKDYDDAKLSVIVPVYNAQKYLNRCVKSILNQSYNDLELILVDDGSTDQSSDLCDNWSKKDRRVRVYHIKNAGPSNARNYGLKVARGRFIAFVDSDDFLNPDMYEKMIPCLDSTNCGMVVCKWLESNLNTGEKKIPNIGMLGIIQAPNLKGLIASDDNMGGGGFPWNKVIDRKKLRISLEKVQFRKNLRVYEDKVWLLELLDYMDDIMLMDYVGYNYEVREISLSHGNYSARIEDFIAAWKIMQNDCFRGCITKEIEKYRAVGIIDYFWKVKQEKNDLLVKKLWPEQKKYVRKALKELSAKQIIKWILIDLNCMIS